MRTRSRLNEASTEPFTQSSRPSGHPLPTMSQKYAQSGSLNPSLTHTDRHMLSIQCSDASSPAPLYGRSHQRARERTEPICSE